VWWNSTHVQDGSDQAPSWLRSKGVDWIATAVGWAIPLVSWIRSGKARERLADIEVPRSLLMTTLIFAWVGRRQRDRTWARFGEITEEFGTLVGTRMRETEERSKELLALQGSTERFAAAADKRDDWFAETQERFLEIQGNMERLAIGSDRRDRRLLQLTVVIAVIGLLSTSAAVWSVVR